MAAGLEPAFTPRRPVWPLAGMSPAGFEPDDPDLAIPHGALQPNVRDMPERLFRTRDDGLITLKPTEPLAPREPKTRDLHRKWKLAVIASCFFHAAVAFFLVQAADDAAKIEGAEYSGEAMLGNASEEQVSAGDIADFDGAVEVTMITMLEAKPVETIEALAVPVEEGPEAVEALEPTVAEVETLQPVEETRAQPADVARAEEVEVEQAEPVEPAQAQPVQPEARAEAAAAEKVREVLATDRLAEESDAVQRPSAKPEQSETGPLEPTAPERTVEAEAEPERKKAEQNPTPKKAEAKELPAEKKPAPNKQETKPKAKNEKVGEKTPSKRMGAGSGGTNKADTRRGQANGAAGSQASSKSGKSSAAGNAAVSNYPGKVAAKLRRALRYPAEAKRKRLRGTVQVAFVVSASGGVGSVRVVSSSGSPVLDKAAVETVRRAAPFPRIPAAAGRSSWPFSVPLSFSR